MGKPLDECSREELVEIIKSQKETISRTKKFGLVWEDKPEKVATDCAKKLPVIKEVADRAINEAGDSEPTNVIIEGDNYHALSVLNYTHAGKIDVIYIDPPYNTGNTSWRYNNNYVSSEDSFRHSKFISYLNKRILLSKNLLKPSGIFVITIDDYEIGPVRLLMDSIFGEENRLGLVTIMHNPRGRSDDKFFATSHEYALFYAKDKNLVKTYTMELTDEQRALFKHEDDISSYRLLPLKRTGSNSTPKERPKLFFPLYINKKTLEISVDKKNAEGWDEVLPVDGRGEYRVWRWGKPKIEAEWKDEIIVKKNGGKYSLFTKDRIKEGRKPKTIWTDSKYDASSHGTVLLEKMLGKRKVFDYPKSLYALLDTLEITSKKDKDAIILDYFAGSGTTGHAVMNMNASDGGHRSFILCTNNENNIAEEVTYPRIKAVVDGYQDGKTHIEGIPSNIRYFKTEFIDKNDTMDKLRRELSPACEDMIRVREGAYEKIIDDDMLKVFKNSRGLTAIIYDRFELAEYIQKIEALDTDAPVHLYVFSYSKSNRKDEMPDNLKHKYEAQPIPEGVLEIYKKIFANIKGGKNA